MSIEMKNLIIQDKEFEVVDASARNTWVNVDNYKNLVNGEDWTLALQTATNANQSVVISHDIKIYGTITIPDNHTIKINGIRVYKPADADNNDPIFYLGHSYSSLTGFGPNSTVRSYRPSPDGVIKIGQSSNTVATETVIYCQVSDLIIRGVSNSDDNIGIHLCGTYGASPTYYASYFHFLTNLVIHTFAMGIVFNNAANANIVNNIQFWGCGYSRTTGAFCFIRTQGEYSIQRIPLENVITNAFHHNSANATTLYFGTALGFNRIDNIVCEQGGTDSHVYVVNTDEIVSSLRNTIKYTNNSNAGTITSDEFKSKNTIESQSHYRTVTLYGESVQAESELLLKGVEIRDLNTQKFYITNDSGLYENTEYTIAQIPANTGARKMNCTIKLVASSGSASLQTLNRYKISTYNINFNGSGAANRTVTEVGNSEGTLDLTINSDGEIRMKLPNNGTGTHNTDVRLYLEIFGWFPSSGLTINDGFTRAN